MKQYLAYFLSVVFCFTCNLQSATAQTALEGDSLPPARYALQFQLAEQFNVRSFAVSMLSIRQYREDRSDRRWALSFDGDIQQAKQSLETQQDTIEQTERQTSNALSGRLIGQHLTPVLQRGPVQAYWAWGWTVPFGMQYRPKALQWSDPDTNYISRTERYTDWNIGVGGQGNLGVEVHWNEWMYWFVEYGVRAELRYRYERQKTIQHSYTPERVNVSQSTTVRFDVSPVRLSLGLAVQF